MRAVGQILLELEETLDELITDHEVQWGDVLALVHSHLMVHHPEAREHYVSGGAPEFYYGPREEE